MARIALLNHAGVETEALEAICVASSLPPGHILLIVGDADLPDDLQGVTVARALMSGSVYGFDAHTREPWDCGVALCERWAKRQKEYPCYFSYLLAHEFGHATTALTHLELTAYEDLILRHVQAVSGRTKWRWDELPHERRYDAFAMAVVDELFGRPASEAEFESIIANGLTNDPPRLRLALQLSASKDLSPLRTELREFATPWKAQFIRRWEEERATHSRSVAAKIARLDALWDVPQETDPGNN